MTRKVWAVIKETGHYLPERVVPNSYFNDAEFFDSNGEKFKNTKGENEGKEKTPCEIVDKFEEITGIRNRRWVEEGEDNIHLAIKTARNTLQGTPDCIVVAHNFGSPKKLGVNLDIVPSIANGTEHYMGIQNSNVRAYDLIGSDETLSKVIPAVSSDSSLVLGRGINSLNRQEVYSAAKKATEGRDPNTLESIIVTHDSGRVECIAERVREGLGLPLSVLAFDVAGGCPGALIGSLIVDKMSEMGLVKISLVEGVETLSRVSDPHDMDRMLYSDGGGGVEIHAVESVSPIGIISSAFKTKTYEHAFLLQMRESYGPNFAGREKFLKMDGHKLFELAKSEVGGVMKESLDVVGLDSRDLNGIIMHQMNGKLMRAIFCNYMLLNGVRSKRVGDDYFFDASKLRRTLNPGVSESLSTHYGEKDVYTYKELCSVFMPVLIEDMGNNSVATDFVVYDNLRKGRLKESPFVRNGLYNFTSVGAGMNIVSLDHKEAA